MFHYVAGYRLMYSLGIIYSKEQAKECMLDKKATTQKLTLSAADYNLLKWTEDNKELTLNNEMYDVANIQKSGDNYILTVYIDDKETQWTANYHDFEKQIYHSDQSSKNNKSAEEVMSAFQKEFTPVAEFKIDLFNTSGLQLPSTVAMQHSLSLPDNIFHPPSNC